MKILPPVSIEARRLLPSRWDVAAALLVLGFIVLFADVSRHVIEPLTTLKTVPLSLSPWALPGYALRTALTHADRNGFFAVFTFTYATWAAKSQRAGALLVPLLDILQSVPILGFPVVHAGVLPVSVAGPDSRGRVLAASSSSSPARPGTWPSASTSRCAPSRPN